MKIYDLDAIKNWPLSRLKTGKDIYLKLMPNDDDEYVPFSFIIKKIDGENMQVTSKEDWINDIQFLLDDIERGPVMQIVYVGNLLRSLIKAVKQTTEGNYKISIEDGDDYFSYQLVVSGNTVGEAMEKIFRMYKKVAKKNSSTFADLRNNLIS